MAEYLKSVGLDVGTTSTQLILSELAIENRGGSFSVPRMEILNRRILYRSPVHFTPLLDENRVDGEGVRRIVEKEYEKAGITREQVDTGAVIITGETSRKENAKRVLDAVAAFAGDFVVTTAGPALESVLAAKGAGAVELSEQTEKPVLHMDIGGGTSNLAWIRDGKILGTGCLNVGGRLVKLDHRGTVTYVSPALVGLCSLGPGDRATPEQMENLTDKLTQALEMAAELRPAGPLLQKLWTREAGGGPLTGLGDCILSFSGGVADCIETERNWLEFGDIGPILGQKIRKSRLCAGTYRLGSETIRATVIGAGCHSAQLSGSTVFHQNVTFPLKNLPVVKLTEQEQRLPPSELALLIRKRRQMYDSVCVLSLPGDPAADYARVKALAEGVTEGMAGQPVLVALEWDMAKALGQAIALTRRGQEGCLCLDGVCLETESFLDVGAPVGPALPVVIKTMIFGDGRKQHGDG